MKKSFKVTPDSLESKFLAEANTDETKDSKFPQPAVVTLNENQFEKQQVPTFKSNEDSWGKSLIIFRHSLLQKLNNIN